MEFKPPILDRAQEIGWIKKRRLEKKLNWPPLEEGKEIRYGIVDKKLHEFLSYCIAGLLSSSESLMRYIWRYKRKPTENETQWHDYIYGKRYTTSYFLRVNQDRSQLEKMIGKTSMERKNAKAAADADYKACIVAGDFQSLKYKSACEIQSHFAGIEP